MASFRIAPPTQPSQRRRVILGAIAWIAGLEFFLAEAIAAAGWPGYSYRELDISYLGATSCAGATGASLADPDASSVFDLCSPRHAWMNGGLTLLGTLYLAGVALTWSAWPRTWLTTLGLASLACAASGAVLLGFSPVSEPPFFLHTTSASVALVMGNAGAFLLGLATLKRAPAFAAVSLAAGALGLAGALFYSLHVYLGLGRGGMERVAAYSEIAWFALAGAVLLWGALRAGQSRAAPLSPR